MVDIANQLPLRTREKLYEAQVAVIGSLLIDPDIVGEAMVECRAEDFTDSTCRHIFEACQRVYFSKRAVDAVTVYSELNEAYLEPMKEIMYATPTSSRWKLYAEIMKEQATLFRIQELGAEIMVAQDLGGASELADKLSSLFCQRPGIRCVSFYDGLSEFFARHGTTKKAEYLTWGYSALNDKLSVESGDFVVIGGRPSAGKTMLACSFAWHMAISCKKRVGIFSFETSDRKLYDRLICRVSGVDFDEIKHSRLSSESWESVGDISTFADSPLYVIQASGMTVQDIKSISLSNKFDVIFIDYMQKIKTPRRNNRAEEVSEVSDSLQAFAQGTKTTVVALSQLSRAGKGEKDEPPTLESLRESGQIEQDADIVMLLYSTDRDVPASDRKLFIAKNKDGELGRLTFGFDPKHMRFDYVGPGSAPSSRPAAQRKPEQPPAQQKFWELPDSITSPWEKREESNAEAKADKQNGGSG